MSDKDNPETPKKPVSKNLMKARQSDNPSIRAGANNITPFGTEGSFDPREAQRLSAKKRSENAAARRALKMTMEEWSKYKTEVLDDQQLTGLDVMKTLMIKALHENDFEVAADLASKIAEYEAPKLARTESTTVEVDATDMTDEELNTFLKKNGVNPSDS